MFIRNGWDVYISDAVERGRSGFAPPEIWLDPPLHLTKANPFERFRIGPRAGWNSDPAKREPYPGNQFPAEAYDNFTKQFAPRWTGTDDAVIAAYVALVDKVGPSILMFHSQAGAFGFKVAEARPDLVKALIAIEPAVAGDAALAGRLKHIPTLMVYGDYIARDSRWPHMHRLGLAYAACLRAAGGIVDVVNLPEAGINLDVDLDRTTLPPDDPAQIGGAPQGSGTGLHFTTKIEGGPSGGAVFGPGLMWNPCANRRVAGE